MKRFRNMLFCLGSIGTLAMPALGAGITPMKAEGFTPSDNKAFRLTIVNPYKNLVNYTLTAYEPDLVTPAKGVKVNRANLRIPGQRGRKVILVIGIPAGKKEREIALCVHSPDKTQAILARVCGRYVGKRYR